jgi:hypothetical protein
MSKETFLTEVSGYIAKEYPRIYMEAVHETSKPIFFNDKVSKVFQPIRNLTKYGLDRHPIKPSFN